MGVIYGAIGDGSGYGYGSGSYIQTILESHRPKHLPDGALLAFWRSGKDGRPANGGGGNPRTAGMIEEEPGPLRPCNPGALHATLNPSKWKGERLWVVALYPPVVHVDADKAASLKREIIAEIPNFFV